MTYFPEPGIRSVGGSTPDPVTGDVQLFAGNISIAGGGNRVVAAIGAATKYTEVTLANGTTGNTIALRTSSGQLQAQPATLPQAAVVQSQSPTATSAGVILQGAAATDLPSLLTSLRAIGVIAP